MSATASKLICIDAGHGLYTAGRRCRKALDPTETREWVLNARVADKVAALLAAYDCTTMRADDPTGKTDVPLADRVKAANSAKADVYLSIHHNAGVSGGSGGGTVAYVCPGAQEQSKALRKAVYGRTVSATGLRGNRADPMPESGLYVLLYTTMPAVLIECGFMDSTTDVPIILTEEFADQTAEGITAALAEVLGLKKKEERQRMRYSKVNGIHIAEVPAKDFKIVMVDSAKKSAIKGNGCNAGFFGNFKEQGAKFTLPVGPLVCDMAVDGWAGYYCRQRGAMTAGKLRYPCGTWDKQFYGKAVSTLIVSDGKAGIFETAALPLCDYAIMGVPVIRDGKAVSFAQAKAQGWDGSTLYATWHIFAGVKEDGKTVYIMGAKTTSGNLLSGEGWRLFGGMGFTDLIKVDGGGSFIFKAAGKTQQTLENRRISTIFDFGDNPWLVPTRTLKQGSRGNDVRWLQWELTDRGFACGVDGSFGPGTKEALAACQKALGLAADGSCGPGTRAALQK